MQTTTVSVSVEHFGFRAQAVAEVATLPGVFEFIGRHEIFRLPTDGFNQAWSRERRYRSDKCSRLSSETLASAIRYTIFEIRDALDRAKWISSYRADAQKIIRELRVLIEQWNITIVNDATMDATRQCEAACLKAACQ